MRLVKTQLEQNMEALNLDQREFVNQLNAEKLSREKFEMKYKSELEKSVAFSHEIEKVNNSKTSFINRIVELVENIGGESPTEVEDEELRFRQSLRSIQDCTSKL